MYKNGRKRREVIYHDAPSPQVQSSCDGFLLITGGGRGPSGLTKGTGCPPGLSSKVGIFN